MAKFSISTRYHFYCHCHAQLLPMIRPHVRLSSSAFHSLRRRSFSFNLSASIGYSSILRNSSGKAPGRREELIAMTSLTQTRLHGGHSHSHSHSHHHDNTYLTSANKKDAGVRITRIGLYVNLLMAIGKGIGGYYFNSQALVADAFHALTDLVSDFMTLGTVSWSLKPPSSRFPSGYGKIESLGSLGVSSLLLVGGILMGLNACEVLYHQFFVDAVAAGGHSHGGIFGHSHSHNPTDLGPNINAAGLAAGSIVIKEYLYRASKVVVNFTKSITDLDLDSHENCQGAKIFGPSIQCRPSPYRFSDQHCRACGHWRISLIYRHHLA
jgi:hypothetical protein